MMSTINLPRQALSALLLRPIGCRRDARIRLGTLMRSCRIFHCTETKLEATLGAEERHGTDPARQGVGRAHGTNAAVGPDTAFHRTSPHPRGDNPPGLSDVE